ncbi:MAG: efflux RND transporter periplasmic adaptor subunit [Alphaproteobacteria bacterium]|nr:efflux RND transporter periplasmic adaptor subunit [Alphaproteobacteria bacterium]
MFPKCKLIFLTLNLLVIQSSIGSVYAGVAQQESSQNNREESHEHNAPKKAESVKLSNEQQGKFDIRTLVLKKENFQHRLTFPGQITLNENKIAHVIAPVPGVVKQILKGLGESVKQGDALVVLQSREMSEAKSSFVIAHKNVLLQKDLLEREEKLWRRRFTAEIRYIQAKNSYEAAKVSLEQAKQKLMALSLSLKQIDQLTTENQAFNLYTVYAPMNGNIIERDINIGENITGEKQIFVVAQLDTVWINLAISAEDLHKIKQNQSADIISRQDGRTYPGKITYISPVIDQNSRTGRAIIEINNTKQELHPGDFIKAQVITGDQSGLLSLPNTAIQRIDGQSVVFVKISDETFEGRTINIKGSDKSEFVEILSGLKEGDEIAVSNTYMLKAELGKNEAEHAH